MPRATRYSVAFFCMTWVLGAGVVRAQSGNPLDSSVDTIRQLTAISQSDQDRILRWVQYEVDNLQGFGPFRQRFRDQYNDTGNSAAFKTDLARQTAQVAGARFAAQGVAGQVARSVAQILVDMNVVETVPGLVAGLRSADSGARYLCAKGLSAQKVAIAADNATLTSVVAGLSAAGSTEQDPVVLGRIYEALGYGGQLAAVFDVYIKLFDQRLQFRRGAAVVADGAENYAYEFFRASTVAGALSATQKKQLVGRVAVFLRFDAERYNTANLSFDEMDRIERVLDGAEEILAASTGITGGNIRDRLRAGGFGNRAAVVVEAYRWVGDPKASQPGALSAAPWSVPLGAP